MKEIQRPSDQQTNESCSIGNSSVSATGEITSSAIRKRLTGNSEMDKEDEGDRNQENRMLLERLEIPLG